MADSVQQLLGKWTLDNSAWVDSVNKVKGLLQGLNTDDAARAAKNRAAQSQSLSGVQAELAVRTKLAAQSADLVAGENAKAAAAKSASSQALAAAQTQLEATMKQIAAEKQRAAALKLALLEQKNAAAQSIAYEQAYAAQVKEVAKNKAVAAALYDAAYQAQVSEVKAKKQLPTQKPLSSGDLASGALSDTRNVRDEPNEKVQTRETETSQAPIITHQEERVPLEETEVASYKAQSAAAEEASAAGVDAAEKVVVAEKEAAAAVSATSAEYKRLAAAMVEVQAANANVAETKAAIGNGQSSGARLAADLEAQAAAVAELGAAKEAVSAAESMSEEKVLALKQAQSIANGRLIDQEQAIARQQEMQALKEDIIERNKQQQANRPWYRKMLDSQSDNGSSGSSRGSSTPGGSAYQKDRALADLASGRSTMRPMESMMTKMPGMGTLADIAFPVAGAAMFISLITDGVEKIQEMVKAAKEFKSNMDDAFQGFLGSEQSTNDHLQLTNDQLLKTIGTLEHKPANNGLALAMDEARIKADDLAKSAMTAYSEVKKLLEANTESTMQKVLQGDGSTKEVDYNINNQMKQIKDAARAYQDAMHGTDQQAIASSLQRYNSAKVNAGAYARDQIKMRTGTSTLSYTDEQMGHAREGQHAGTIVPYAQVNGNQDTILDHLGLLSGYVNDRNTNDQETIDNGNLQNRRNQDENKNKQNQIGLKNAQADLEVKRAENAKELEDAKAQAAGLQEINEAAYKSGQEAASEFYANKKALADQAYIAAVQDIQKERAAQLAELDIQNKLDLGMTQKQYTDKKSVINSNSDRGLDSAAQTRDKAQSDADIEAQAASDEAAKKQVQDNLAVQLKGFQEQTQANQEMYNQQLESADDYLAQSKDLIQQELAARISAAEQIMQINGANSAANIDQIKAEELARADAAEKLDKLAATSLQTRVQGSSSNYQSQSTMLSGQMSYLQNPNNAQATPSAQREVVGQQISATTTYAAQQSALLDEATASGQQYSTTWFTIYDNINKAKSTLTDLNAEMKTLSTSSAAVGTMFQSGASSMGSMFTSHFGQGMLSAISAGGSSAANANKNLNGLENGGDWIQTNDPTPSSSQTGPGQGGSLNIGDTIDSFTKHIGSAVTALGSFVSSITNAGSATAGAFGGGISGGGLGNSVGSAVDNSSLTNSGGPLSGIAGMAGPLGAALGAGMGAALGGIMGQKQEEVQTDITNLTLSFKDIMSNYSSNNASLTQTVANLESLISQAEADQASSKKGGSQFAQLITQYNEQITQLEDQQSQIMAQMSQQLVQVGSPQAYQPIINSIQEIVQQYTQFVGAASNATQLAQANEYLTTSLQNLGQTYTETLQQDEENAIQEALQLNQLYDQRNQLEYEYLQQVQSIQGQGTLTRGTTLAQSKYSQLYNLDVNTANQLNQINEQINLTQYQVSAAQQVFQLATTQAGLQTQLLALQEQGVNLDMSRISAMQNTLQMLQSTGYSIVGNLATLNTSDPNALMTLLLQILAQELGVNAGGTNSGPSGGTQSYNVLTSLTSGAYATQGAYGYGGYSGTNL